MSRHQPPKRPAALVARRATAGRLCASVGALCLATVGGLKRVHAENEVSPAPALPAPAPPAAAPEPVKESPTPMLPEAQAHYDHGLERYRARDFAGAIRALEQGYAIEPRREFLFAEAQAMRLGGDCARAIPLYQRFIDSGPQPVQAQAARLGIDRCAPERTPAVPPPPIVPPSAGPGASTPIGGPPPGDRPRWWKDPWVLSAGGVGLAALGVGVVALVGSNSSADQAQSSRTTSHAEFDRLWAEATQRRTIAIAGLAAGAGLVAASGVRALWLWHHHDHWADSPNRLSLTAGAHGATLLWEGRF